MEKRIHDQSKPAPSHLSSPHLRRRLLSLPPSPHPHSFPPLLKLAATLNLIPLGLSLHQLSIALKLASDPYISSSLLNFYSKTHRILDASNVFNTMPDRNIVPWSSIIAAYSLSGDPNTAFSMCNRMLYEGIRPNSVTLIGFLSGLSKLDQLECVHGCAVRFGFDKDLVLANSMVNVYGKLERLDLARLLFDEMDCKDVVSWNSMIVGYSRVGEVRECASLFKEMRVKGECPDHQTYGSLLSSIGNHGEGLNRLGKSIHALVINSGLQFDTQIETGLISFYLKFGNHKYAFLIFENAADRDVVLWTAMISGLVQNDGADKALVVFQRMLKSGVMPATTTVASVLSACAQLSLLLVGASIHCFIIRRRLSMDIAAKNSLITMYAKCGHLTQSYLIFEKMDEKDLVSWNAIVSGYAQNGHLEEAFDLFTRMRLVFQRPDTITVASLLQSCASLGALMHGRLLHAFMFRHELKNCISLDTSLVDMYSKCGDLKTAQKCFDLMPEQDLVSWSAIIGGYGSHGMGKDALEMYSDFLKLGIVPNDVMYMSILSACNHSGLVSQGLTIFKSIKDFGTVPRIEHCACVIDLLCKAKRVEEAIKFIRTMPIKPNADVLGIVLDACRLNGYNNLAEVIAKEIVELRPESAGNYVQLAHSYAAMSQWDGVGDVWATMRHLGLRKAPGWSFVELNGVVVTFFADSSSNPRYQEIVFLLKILRREMREIDDLLCG
ncbi:pentatricopeptide repeat-containing protein At4g04370 [Asparagus officinalis]|uniref:pentatricopeptide repeat-containing protein At4g04370 n=1 Tax=Asparagus officinalis TaxID=4686 RepID=UPI00098E3F12|nr:pentatricopeptide repeat-containing protein At4g04370 [Asparagus officinalis]